MISKGYKNMLNGDYILVNAPKDYPGKKYRGKYIYEHHLVYWQNTGRILQPGEELHHKNGNKHKNYFENLELTTKPLHSKKHGIYKLRCPSCNKIFFRKKRLTHLTKLDSKVTCCSRKCSGKWPSIRKHNKNIAKFRKVNNVMEVFKTNSYYAKSIIKPLKHG